MTTIYNLLADKPALRERLLSCTSATTSSHSSAEVPPAILGLDAAAGHVQVKHVPAPAPDHCAVPTLKKAGNLQQEPTELTTALLKTRSHKNNKRASQRQTQMKALPEFVQQVRTMTRGKKLFIVGDLCRAAEHQRIESLLECEVVWWEAKKGESLAPMKAAGTKSDLLVFITRDASHAHTKGLIALSRETGIPVVNVPKGASENIIAYEINRQLLRAA